MDVLKKILVIGVISFFFTSLQAANHTLIDKVKYRQQISTARQQVSKLLTQLKTYRHTSRDTQISFLLKQLSDLPYLYQGIGEGDWQADSATYKSGGTHIQQNPLYRMDGFDCQSLVQMVMSLLYANNIDEFDMKMVSIAYGAFGNFLPGKIHFYNRNHFIDGDWNPVNQRNGFFSDATAFGPLSKFAQSTTVTLDRQRWFLLKNKNLPATLNLLDSAIAPAMQKRFATVYMNLKSDHFQPEKVTLAYLPKNTLVIRTQNVFKPNSTLYELIPTPSVIEIVNNPKRWWFGKRLIKEAIGTELSISHVGLLYRQTFKKNDLIYQKITCENTQQQPRCLVTPQRCESAECNEIMLTHATSAYPKNYYWYAETSGKYVCTAKTPPANVPKRFCNRVEHLPLIAYVTDFQYGYYRFLSNPAILGVHIEKLH